MLSAENTPATVSKPSPISLGHARQSDKSPPAPNQANFPCALDIIGPRSTRFFSSFRMLSTPSFFWPSTRIWPDGVLCTARAIKSRARGLDLGKSTIAQSYVPSTSWITLTPVCSRSCTAGAKPWTTVTSQCVKDWMCSGA